MINKQDGVEATQAIDEVVAGGTRVRKEDLAEVAVTLHGEQGSRLHPGLTHVEQQETDAVVLGDVGIGAREQKPVVRVLTAARPDLLPVDSELIPREDRPGAQGRQVRTRLGLAEELAPDLLAAEHGLQVALPLGVRAEANQRRAHQRDRRVEEAVGDVEAGLLLAEDQGLGGRAPAPPEFRRPGDGRPAALVEGSLPVAHARVVFAVGLFPSPTRPQRPIFRAPPARRVGLQPAPHLRAEGALFGRVRPPHQDTSTSFRARPSRCRKASPNRISELLARRKKRWASYSQV